MAKLFHQVPHLTAVQYSSPSSNNIPRIVSELLCHIMSGQPQKPPQQPFADPQRPTATLHRPAAKHGALVGFVSVSAPASDPSRHIARAPDCSQPGHPGCCLHDSKAHMKDGHRILTHPKWGIYIILEPNFYQPNTYLRLTLTAAEHRLFLSWEAVRFGRQQASFRRPSHWHNLFAYLFARYLGIGP